MMSEETKFAGCRRFGTRSGYTGDNDTIRQAGSAAAKTARALDWRRAAMLEE
jgi:uncharacterized membrane-anchored protein